MGFKITGGQPTLYLVVHELIIPAQRKTQEFQLIVCILNGMGRQVRQCKIPVVGFEQHSLDCFLSMGLGLEHGLPKYLFLGHAKAAKGIDTHQNGQLFDGNRDTIDKVIKILIDPVLEEIAVLPDLLAASRCLKQCFLFSENF